MGAAKGSQFWKLRTSLPTSRKFAGPVDLWQQAAEYFEWIDKNPFKEIQYLGRNAVKRVVPKMKPYTITGLCVYLDCSTARFHQFKNDPKCAEVYTRIMNVIYTQKFEGAASGFLNPTIISRDLDLVEKTDTSINLNLSDEQFIQLLKNAAEGSKSEPDAVSPSSRK